MMPSRTGESPWTDPIALVEDEEEAAAPVVVDPKRQLGTRDIACPECGTSFQVDALGCHLERHREVGGPLYDRKGRCLSLRCAKGCGRWFRLNTAGGKSSEQRRHEGLCLGEPPLPRLSIEDRRRQETSRRDAAIAQANVEALCSFERRLVQPDPTTLLMEDLMPPKTKAAKRRPRLKSAGATEAVQGSLDCPYCGKKYKRGGIRRGKHLMECRSRPALGTALVDPKVPIVAEGGTGGLPNGNGSLKTKAQELRADAKRMRDEAAQLVKRAGRLEEIAAEIETL